VPTRQGQAQPLQTQMFGSQHRPEQDPGASQAPPEQVPVAQAPQSTHGFPSVLRVQLRDSGLSLPTQAPLEQL
jgi:hypothetical protein